MSGSGTERSVSDAFTPCRSRPAVPSFGQSTPSRAAPIHEGLRQVIRRRRDALPAVLPRARATDLYVRYGRQILAFCLHRLGSREEAEDAAQTTFLNAFRGLERGVVPELEQAWLFTIAERVCLTRRRSYSRRRRVEAPSSLEALQDVVPSPERSTEELIPLGDALARLPATQRRALLLREWHGLSYREIAAELGLTQAAVETLLFRGRRSLAKSLVEPASLRRRATG